MTKKRNITLTAGFEDDDADGDENGNDSMSVSPFSQKWMRIKIQAKLTARLLLRTVTEPLNLRYSLA